MSELESKIKALSLRVPNDSLDDRIMTAIRNASVNTPDGAQTLQAKTALDGDTRRAGVSSNRKGVALTSGWIVASVSMIIGGVVGNSLPSLSSIRGKDNHASLNHQISAIATHGGNDMTDKTRRNHAQLLADSGLEDLSRPIPGSIASQIVESIWISPAAAAVAWEQQTGQIFDVANHVNDRRFDMCRECHRVGG